MTSRSSSLYLFYSVKSLFAYILMFVVYRCFCGRYCHIFKLSLEFAPHQQPQIFSVESCRGDLSAWRAMKHILKKKRSQVNSHVSYSQRRPICNSCNIWRLMLYLEAPSLSLLYVTSLLSRLAWTTYTDYFTCKTATKMLNHPSILSWYITLLMS